MKLEEVFAIVEEQRWYDIKEFEKMSPKLQDAIKALDNDIVKVKKVLSGEIKTGLRWNQMSSGRYIVLMEEFYKLKENALDILEKRKMYDLNPNSPMSKILIRKRDIGNDQKIASAKNILAAYESAYKKLKELTALIREGRNKKLLNINIPSVEFKLPLLEEIND